MQFIKLYGTDIKTFYAFQQSVLACAGNLTYGLRLQMNMGDVDVGCALLDYFEKTEGY